MLLLTVVLGNFLILMSECTLAPPLQVLWNYVGFFLTLWILLFLSLQHEEGTHIFIRTQCGIKYLTGFEVLA